MLKRTKKLLSGLLVMSMVISSAAVYAAEGDPVDYSVYTNMLADWNAEGTKTCTNNNLSVDIVEDAVGAPEGSHYYRINQFPYNWVEDGKYRNFDTDAVEFIKDEVYHISFWVKQELPQGVTGDLWKGIKVLIADSRDFILANDEDYFRYGGSGYMHIDQTNEWQYKSIIYKHSIDTEVKPLRIRGNAGASNKVNLYLDGLSVRRVPDPDKYVTADGGTMFLDSGSNASSLIRFHNSSYNSNAKKWAEDLISSQITLNSAKASTDSVTLVFNDVVGANLGECGVDTTLIEKGIKGVNITGELTTSVDTAAGTTTVVIPCTAIDDTFPIEITGLKDVWGKTVADIKMPSVQQSLPKGNMVKNAYFESTDYWSVMSGNEESAMTLDTNDKIQGNASLSLTKFGYGNYPLKQTLDVDYIDEKAVMQLSAWTKSTTPNSALRLYLRVNQKEAVDGASYYDFMITDQNTDFNNATANEWSKRSFEFKLEDKISEANKKYYVESNIKSYEIYLLNLTADIVEEYNIDNMFLGYSEPITTELSGAFYGEDNTLTLAFTSNKASIEPIVTGDTIDESKIELEYFNGVGTPLSTKILVSEPDVTQDGVKTFVKYTLTNDAIYFPNKVFAVKIDGVKNISRQSVDSKIYDVFKTRDTFMVCYQTSGLEEGVEGATWKSSQLSAEMFNKEVNINGFKPTTTAVMVTLYNASDAAVTPMGVFAFYDADGAMKKVILREYKELAPGEIYDAGTAENARFQFNSEEKKHSEINMLWWNSETYNALNRVINIDEN